MYLSSNSIFQTKKPALPSSPSPHTTYVSPVPSPSPSPSSQPPMAHKEFVQRLLAALQEQMPGEGPDFRAFMAMMICACRDARKEARLTVTGTDDPEVNSSSLKLPPAVDSTGKLAPLKTREVWIEYGPAEPMGESSDPQLSLTKGVACTSLGELWNNARSKKPGDNCVLLDMELVSVGPTIFAKCTAVARPEEPLSRYYSDYKAHRELDVLSTGSDRQDEVEELFYAAKRMTRMLMEKKYRNQIDRATAEPSVEELACVRLIILLLTLVCKTTLEFSCILNPGYEDITLRAEGMPSVSVPLLMYIKEKHPSVLIQFDVSMRQKHLLLDDVAPSLDGQQQRGDLDEYSVRPISSHHLVVDFVLKVEGAKAAAAAAAAAENASASAPAAIPVPAPVAPQPEEPTRMTGKKRGREESTAEDEEAEFSHKRIKLEL